MAYTLQSPTGENISIDRNFWTGKTTVLANGGAVNGKREGGLFSPRMAYPLPSGATLTVRPNGLDPAPKIFVNDQQIQVARKLEVWEYLLCGLPILLPILTLGGGLQIGLGIVGLMLNMNAMRAEGSAQKRILSVLGISAVIIVIGLAISIGLGLLIYGARR
jgi:hypothetical protein